MVLVVALCTASAALRAHADRETAHRAAAGQGTAAPAQPVISRALSHPLWQGWRGEGRAEPLAERPADRRLDRKRYALSFVMEDNHHRQQGRVARAGSLIAIRGDRATIAPRIALDAAAVTPDLLRRGKRTVEAGFRELNGMLKNLGLVDPASGERLALRIRPIFTSRERADWTIRLFPGNERAGGLPDHTVLIFTDNRPAVVAHEATHKVFAAADEYEPFRAPILHRGDFTLMSTARHPLAPHSLVPFADMISAIRGQRLVPDEHPAAVAARGSSSRD